MGSVSAGVTRRELEVLALVGEMQPNAGIASRLHLSVRTVENHVASLLRKYGVSDRRALAEAAAGLSAGAEGVGGLAGCPEALTRFIGRASEREVIADALRESRLVTLHGPGGVGKTRLAAEVARTARQLFPSGRVFIGLVSAREGYVAQAVAAALDVSERPDESLEDAIADRLGASRFLLVLDNCEHLIDAAATLAERLLTACPGLRILATSRERLGLRGECVISLAPLPLGSDAELLFNDRLPGGGTDETGAAAVTDICARLDGMPLAIELAAARTGSLGIAGVLAGLDDCLRLLTGGRGTDERHRSLRAVIDWSHGLLDEEERGFFRRLAVFAGAFTMDAAVAVAGAPNRASAADLLGRLADKSLIVHQAGPPNAWRLLDTVRAFAAEQLTAAGEYTDTTARHLAWFADRAADLERRIGGDWRDDFAMVADDLRAALTACPPGAHPLGHKLASALGHLAFARRFLRESLAHYQEAAARSVNPADAAINLSDAAACALFITFSGDDAAELLRAAADRCHEAGDGDGQAIALARAVEISARYTSGHHQGLSDEQAASLLAQAAATGDPENPVVAAALAAATAWHSVPVKLKLDPYLAGIAEQTARATGDPVLICASLDATGTAASGAGRLRDAYRISTERFALFPALDQNRPRAAAEVADMYGMLCTNAVIVGDLPAALAFADRSRDDDLVGSHPFLSVGSVLPTLALMGRLTETVQVATQIWQAWQRAGSPAAGIVPTRFAAAALAHCLLGDDRSAQLWRRRAQEAADIMQGDPSRYVTFFSFVDARCALHTGDLSRAQDVVAAAFSDQINGRYIGYARAAAAEFAIVAGLPDAERLLAVAALDASQSAWAAACVDRATWRLGGDNAALARSAQGWERICARYERACTLLLTPGRDGEGRAELDDMGAVLPVRW